MSRPIPKLGYRTNSGTEDINRETIPSEPGRISLRQYEVSSRQPSATTSQRGSAIREMEVNFIRPSPKSSNKGSYQGMEINSMRKSPVASIKETKCESLRQSPTKLQREKFKPIEKRPKRHSIIRSHIEAETNSIKSSSKDSRQNSATTSRSQPQTISILRQDSYRNFEQESYVKSITPCDSQRVTIIEPNKEELRDNSILDDLMDQDLMKRASIHSVKILSPPSSRHNTFEGKLTRRLSRESSIIDITRTKVAQSRLQLSILCFGLILTTMLAGADETIVSTSLGSITSEFKQAGDLTWVAGAYLLTATAFQPLYGKFSDIFGRGIVMSVALGLFAVGSVGCGSASNLTTLVIFRGVAGMGSGGLESLSYIIVADATPLEQRSLYMSLINITFSIANIFGPLVGGLFVDYFSWRWSFFINLPIGAIAVVIMVFLLPVPKIQGGLKAKLSRIDFMGTITLVIGIVLLVLGINWGGVDYPWLSIPVITCLVMGIILLGWFIIIEWKFAVEPIIPFHIFKSNVIYANLATVSSGVILSTFVYYWPMYYQIIHSSNATSSGLQTLPVLLGDSFFAALSGLISHKTKTYRWMMRLGMILMFTGVLTLAMIQQEYTAVEEIFYPMVIGIGLGLNTQNALVAAQAAVPEDDLAVVTAFATFSLSIGGVFGLAIVGAVFDNVLQNSMRQVFPANYDIMSIIDSHDKRKALPPAALKAVLNCYMISYRALFTALLPPITLGLLATFIMKHEPLVSNTTPKRSAPITIRHPRSSVIPFDSDSITHNSKEKPSLE